jgi:esterase/lipase superfamily enzyme
VPNRVDLWGPDHDHDWPTWREMLPKYLAEHS